MEKPVPHADQVGDVHLIYKIEGQPDEVPVFELARTLEALGTVIQEGDRIVSRDLHDVVVKVKPFQEGSFLMDLVLLVQNNPTVLFFLTHPEAIERIKKVLEYLGLIRKGAEILANLRELIEHLRNGKPARVEPAANDTFNYYNNAGQVLPVNGTIHHLAENINIQNFYFRALGAPLERVGVDGVSTYLKDAQDTTKMFLPKAEAPLLRAFSEPEPDPPRVKTVKNVTTEFVNPKAGTYGDPQGTWIFTRAGTKSSFRARITDEKFLSKFERGIVRFFHDDTLEVKLRTEQTITDGRAKAPKYEISEVVDYTKARPQRRRDSDDGVVERP